MAGTRSGRQNDEKTVKIGGSPVFRPSLAVETCACEASDEKYPEIGISGVIFYLAASKRGTQLTAVLALHGSKPLRSLPYFAYIQLQ